MSQFGDRLKEVMRKKGVSASDLADDIGVHKNSVSNYLSANKDPGASIEVLKKICKVLNCSSDYLLGLSDDTQYTPLATDCAKIIDTLDDLEKEIIFILLEGMKMKRQAIIDAATKTPHYSKKVLAKSVDTH